MNTSSNQWTGKHSRLKMRLIMPPKLVHSKAKTAANMKIKELLMMQLSRTICFSSSSNQSKSVNQGLNIWALEETYLPCKCWDLWGRELASLQSAIYSTRLRWNTLSQKLSKRFTLDTTKDFSRWSWQSILFSIKFRRWLSSRSKRRKIELRALSKVWCLLTSDENEKLTIIILIEWQKLIL